MDRQLFKLFKTHKRRFTATEKSIFLDSAARTFSNHGIKCDIRHSSALGWHTSALIAGDLDSAHTVIVARYDTSHMRLLPVPRYIGSFFGSFISWALPIICILALSALAGSFLPYPYVSAAVIAALLLFFAFAAIPCPNNASRSSGALAAAMAAKAPGVAVILADGSFFGIPMRKLLKKLRSPDRTFITVRYAKGSELAVGAPQPELFNEGAKAYRRRNIIVDIAEPTALGLCINKIGSPSDTELDIECAARAAEAAVSIGRLYRDLI